MLFHAHYETMKGHHVYTTTQVLLRDGGKGPVDLASEEYNGCGWESKEIRLEDQSNELYFQLICRNT